MIILWILAVIVIIVVATFIALKQLKPPFDGGDVVHPECMMCDEESCIGCPTIEAKVGKMH